ncbi:hypothetical protein ACFL4A_03665 [bacterium]
MIMKSPKILISLVKGTFTKNNSVDIQKDIDFQRKLQDALGDMLEPQMPSDLSVKIQDRINFVARHKSILMPRNGFIISAKIMIAVAAAALALTFYSFYMSKSKATDQTQQVSQYTYQKPLKNNGITSNIWLKKAVKNQYIGLDLAASNHRQNMESLDNVINLGYTGDISQYYAIDENNSSQLGEKILQDLEDDVNKSTYLETDDMAKRLEKASITGHRVSFVGEVKENE